MVTIKTYVWLKTTWYGRENMIPILIDGNLINTHLYESIVEDRILW